MDGAASTADEKCPATSLPVQDDWRLWSDLLKRSLRALDALRRFGKVEKIGKGRRIRWRATGVKPA